MGLYKIGWTGNPQARQKGLSGTASPDPYRIILCYPVKAAKRAERLAFSLLADYRYSDKREFFTCDIDRIMKVLNAVQRNINLGVPIPCTFISDAEIDRLQTRENVFYED